MIAVNILSKSQYIKGKQCSKALWYSYHRKDLLPEADTQAEIRFESGREVGELARQLFPGGHLIDCKPWEIEKSLQDTSQLIQSDIAILYEAAVLAPDGAYARVDILEKSKLQPNRWNIIEVKSSTSVKDSHLDDAAMQYYTFSAAGYVIDKCFILHINNEYVRQGDINLAALFKQVDITDMVLSQQTGIPARVESLSRLVTQAKEPQVNIGSHCSSPFDCNFKDHCWKDVPEYSIFDVLTVKKALEVSASTGSYFVKDIPVENIPKGAKAIDLRSHLENSIYADVSKLQAFINPLQYPLYYLDFETIGPAVPMYDGTKPYQNIPFQFSLHIEHAAGKLENKGYLHWHQTDPREEFIVNLLRECGSSGPIIVYNQSFEAGCVSALAEAFPQYAPALLALNARMVDLLVPFKQRWLYHPKQNGSASIKAVLPAFTEKGYEELGIADGMAASNKYFSFMQGNLSENEKSRLYSDLIAYCELDTYAMVELMRIVRSY